MSEIKVKLKKYWKSLEPLKQYVLIVSIIRSVDGIKRGDLFFKSTSIVDRKNFGNINLTITDNKNILEIISEDYTFPKDDEEILEMSIQIINDMIDREIKDNVVDIEMSNLKRPGNEDFTEHDSALDDAFSSLSVSNRDSGGIEMKERDVRNRDGNRHDLDALILALNKGGKTRKKRKRRTRKHLRKKYSAKRMSRKK